MSEATTEGAPVEAQNPTAATETTAPDVWGGLEGDAKAYHEQHQFKDVASLIDHARGLEAKTDPFAGLEGELKEYRDKKGFKDPASLLDSYRHLEKRLGVPDDMLLKIPGEGATEKEVAEYRAKLGVPETVEKYSLGEGMSADDAMFKGFAEIAHEHNVSDTAFQAMQGKLDEFRQQAVAAQEQAFVDGLDEFQAAHPRQAQAVSRALKVAGVSEGEVHRAMHGDVQAFYGALAKITDRMGEATQGIEDGDGGVTTEPSQMSRERAAKEIARLRTDEAFQKQYRSKDRKTREPAIQRMNRLYAIKNGEVLE